MVDININRPVYLAQRDKYYLKAVNNLYEDFFHWPINDRFDKVAVIIELFKETRHQTVCAMRGSKHDESEFQFMKCLGLIIDALEAAQIMIRHEIIVEQDKSFLNKFLNESFYAYCMENAVSGEVAKRIIRNTASLVSIVTERFEILRNRNFKNLPDEERIRYNLMFNQEEDL
ncbi:MAG: hypothetical protein RBU23_10115 [Candidatus Auribacterota bacterium]|jgi:flagellar motor component MotA|nr:hypothetical protein [Candidatus Auribacterota bacterium]